MSRTLDHIRRVCLALPEALEQETWGHPTFRVGAKIFAAAAADGATMNCKAPPGVQAILVGADPARFFVPPYVGPRGWIGVRLDDCTDWDEIAALVGRSYRMTAPRRLLRGQ